MRAAPPAGVGDGHGDADHMRDGVVAAIDGDEAPDAERGGIEQRADCVTRLPACFACSNVSGAVRRSYLRIWKARSVPMPTISAAHGHSSTLPVLSAVMTAATAAQNDTEQHRPEILAHGIDQRRVKYRLQLFLIASLFLVDQLHRQRTRPVWARSSTRRR